MLSPYRVLDLTEGGCLLAGKVLADMNAEVIKIEPPGGSSSRNIGPYYKDDVHPEKSLFWFAYSAGKKSITLDIETADGQEILKELVKGAHFLVESFEPGYLEELGLDFHALKEINPGLVMASITPFGQEGPFADFAATDIVEMAMGGHMQMTGDPDRPPLRVSYPQAELHGGGHAATAMMIAHQYRRKTGRGQHVDVAIEECVVWTLMTAAWTKEQEHRGAHYKREGIMRQGVQHLYEVKDGYVNLYPHAGVLGAATMKSTIEWAQSEGYPLPDILVSMVIVLFVRPRRPSLH